MPPVTSEETGIQEAVLTRRGRGGMDPAYPRVAEHIYRHQPTGKSMPCPAALWTWALWM